MDYKCVSFARPRPYTVGLSIARVGTQLRVDDETGTRMLSVWNARRKVYARRRERLLIFDQMQQYNNVLIPR